jgi:hypothetical protein
MALTGSYWGRSGYFLGYLVALAGSCWGTFTSTLAGAGRPGVLNFFMKPSEEEADKLVELCTSKNEANILFAFTLIENNYPNYHKTLYRLMEHFVDNYIMEQEEFYLDCYNTKEKYKDALKETGFDLFEKLFNQYFNKA